ncbi:O-antigen ligase family protein [Rhizobium sp. FY34]|uniref:O-antigen ligase family protein n=1 Tax=Rhizobium sp. FY34 TaxID=2562309 RepID=UPI0010C0A6FB|nr:O-antigen ligase family protein [Rhizobium sp. FY34]
MFWSQVFSAVAVGERPSAIARIARLVALSLFVLSIAVALLTHGAVYPAAISVSVLLMVISLLTAFFGLGMSRSIEMAFYTVLGLWFTVLFSCLVQAMPLPPIIPAHPAWAVLTEIGLEGPRTLSPDPSSVLSAILPISLPFATLLAALLLFRSDEEVSLALSIFGFAGATFAAIAILQFVFFPDALLLGDKRFYLGSLTGPFVNRNTAATFYGVTLLAILCQIGRIDLLKLLRSGVLSASSNASPARIGLLVGAALVSFVALMLTNSRAGIASTVIGVVVYGIGMVLFPPATGSSAQFRTVGSRHSSNIYLQVLIGLGLLLCLFWLFSGRAMLRAEIQGLDDGRFCILPGILSAIKDNIWTGIGPGAFPSYFPAYRDPSCGLSGFWELAHNFYLDGLLAFGLLFFVALLLVVSFLFRMFGEGIRQRRKLRAVVWAGIASSFIVALHAGLDFSIQIPGFSAWWALFVAFVLRICTNRRKYKPASA